ncbi:MAG: C25 family cysteine peptidase [Caldisericia bacterium]|uniref:C25 family cysteine peptidase n=1 Tax=Thermodesulfovibrio yellowstonii TaxID=28262 RepID=UPI003C7C0003
MLKNKILIFLFLFLIFIPRITLSQEIEKTYSYNFDFDLMFDGDYIEIESNFNKDLTGLPYKNIKIYYENNLEFLNFVLIYKNFKDYKITFNFDFKLTETDLDISNLPKENIIFVGNFEKENEKFLLFKYYPLIYNINSNETFILKEFDIKIKFKRVFYSLSNKNFKQNETYLIIGKNELKDSINFFIKRKEEANLQVIFKPLEDFILQGKDIKINIRNYLKENYKKLNIKYLLLIGGSSEIPYFKVYPYKDRSVLSDFFYGELTSDIDLDKDGKFGEPIDDKIDFYSEIEIGRIPSSDINYVKTVLERTISFEKLESKKSVLSLGAIWNFDTSYIPFTDGGKSLKTIFESTFGIKGFANILLTEREGVKKSDASNIPLTYENFINYQNSLKPSVILWQGHGYINATFRKVWFEDLNKNGLFDENEAKEIKFVDVDSITSFNKDYPSIVFMGSCDNMKGIENSLAYSFIKDYSISVIASTDTAYYGIDWEDYYDGWLQSIMYFFSDSLKDENGVSYSLNRAKEFYFENFINPIQIEESFANLYVFNIFGDPTSSLKTEKKIIKSNSISSKEGELFKISFNSTDKINNIKGSIEFDNNILKFLKIEGENSLYYNFIQDNKILFKIDKVMNLNLFSILFFGKSVGETKILLRGIVINDNNFYDLIESENIIIIKRNYSKYDINEDRIVDGNDLIEFAKSFGSYYLDNDYKSICDFNMDGKIDGLDLIDFSIHFGESYKGG